jgi:hypothetical protein
VPPIESAARLLYKLLIKSLADKPVICERLQFSRPVSPPWRTRKESIDVNRFLCEASTVADYASKWSSDSGLSYLVHLVEEFEEFSKRDLAATAWRHHGSDLTAVEPALEGGLADAEQPRSISRTNGGADGFFEVLLDRGKLSPEGRGYLLANPSESTETLDPSLRIELWHTRRVAQN